MKSWLPIICSLTAPAAAQTPLVEYLFNSTGTAGAVTSSSSTGSDTTAIGLFSGATIDAAGFSGNVGDSVLSLRAASAHGSLASVGTQPINARQVDGSGTAIDNDTLDELTSFTIAGWYNLNQPIFGNGAPRLLANSNTSVGGAGGAGFALRLDGYGVQLQVDDGVVLTPTPSNATHAGVPMDTANQWVFVAVTYDGTATTNNVKFYVGNSTVPVTIFSTNTLNKGVVNGETEPLVLGNRAELNRPLDAFLDNIRIFGSKTDASGVLTDAQLNTFRLSDLPAPADPIAAWRNTYFGTTENTGTAADDFDADFDGMVNLLEYAFDLHPLESSTSPVVVDSLGGYLRIEFPRHVGRTDLTYRVRASDSLTTWSTIATSTAGGPITAGTAHSATESGAGDVKTVLVEDSVPINGNPRRFLKLEVER